MSYYIYSRSDSTVRLEVRDEHDSYKNASRGDLHDKQTILASKTNIHNLQGRWMP